MRSTILAAALLAGLAGAPAGAQPAIYSLGTLLPADTYSNGLAINASGQVAGYTINTPVGPNSYHAVLYSGIPGSGGGMADLGTLGGTNGQGWGINASGQVTGNSDITGNGAYHAFRYTGTPGSGGAMADLGTLGGTYSQGNAINASGQVAGSSTTTGDAATHAFRYSGTPGSGGAMADLGTLGGTDSQGNAINASGQVAGYSKFTGGGETSYHAFIYTGTPGSGGTMADLGTLGGTSSYGYAINASGQVAGYSDITSNITSHAFLYGGTPGSGGAMADLGTLGGGGSYGNAINASGQVVGDSTTTGNAALHAFLYVGTPGVDGQMIDLDAWLKANNPTEGAKWTLQIANGLSDTGLITGNGTYNDGVPADSGTRAFILDASSLVPEPSGLALLAIGSLALLARRRRARV